MNVVKVVLKVKSPVQETKELDFTEKSDEIFEAVSIFNDKFRDWSKRIIITQITKRAMHLLMVMEKANVTEKLSVREIRYFIQYLRNEKGWHVYTREKNKMFETVEFFKPDGDLLDLEMKKVLSNEALYNQQQLDVDFMDQTEQTINMNNESIEHMEDEDTLTVLEYLIKTKDKGSKSNQKNEDLRKVKQILGKWL